MYYLWCIKLYTMMVIYAIINLKNGKKYVGSAVNFSRRKSRHLKELENNKHHSLSLQHSWNKNLPEDYKFIILEKIFNRDILYDREQYWMDYYKVYDKKYGYNMTKTSTHPDSIKNTVYQFSLEGKFIKKWEHCLQAANYLNIDSSGLSKCARGKYRFYGGFIWDYNEKLDPIRIKLANNSIKRSEESKNKMSIAAKNRTDQRKPIIKYDLEGNLLEEFDSSQAAVEKYGYSCGYLSDALNGRHNKAYGFIWKFK